MTSDEERNRYFDRSNHLHQAIGDASAKANRHFIYFGAGGAGLGFILGFNYDLFFGIFLALCFMFVGFYIMNVFLFRLDIYGIQRMRREKAEVDKYW